MELLDGFDTRAIERAVSLLRAGELVAFPTETVYGLGANALDPLAVTKIFEAKRRPHFDPLIVHVGDKEWVARIAAALPDRAQVLIEKFWPGPLTLILEKNPIIPDIVTAGLPTVAVRMPDHPVALNLIRTFGGPIAAPSANPFGYVSTTRASDVADLLGNRVPLILDGGSPAYGIESTIVSVRDGVIRVHRHGAVSVEELINTVGPVREKESGGILESPGELPYHYAPNTPLRIVGGPDEIERDDSGFLAFKRPTDTVPSQHVRILSDSGDMREAAANFFSSLLSLDREKVALIYAEHIPERGLGKAMMDRLRKAAKKSEFVSR
jgi:L-threonylcarbamoyladenylate synthase